MKKLALFIFAYNFVIINANDLSSYKRDSSFKPQKYALLENNSEIDSDFYSSQFQDISKSKSNHVGLSPGLFNTEFSDDTEVGITPFGFALKTTF